MFIVYILIGILMFGLLIALHELGHFAAAKLCGVKVNEFAIGMGPLVFQSRRGETQYSLRLLPIGGFCAMEGEEEGASADPRAFPNRPWWQRLIILLAGVFMNFLTGFLIILCFYAAMDGFSTPVVADFTQGWTAEAQGIQRGDRVLAVDGHAIYLTGDVELFLSRSPDDRVDLTLLRQGQKVELKDYQFSALTDPRTGETLRLILGIDLVLEENNPLTLLKNTWYQAVDYVRLVWLSLGDLVTGAVGLRDMSGVVEITRLMADLGEAGAESAAGAGMLPIVGALVNILWFVAFIAINLAVMNLLPIPALDGGQIFFMVINGLLLAIRGRKLDPKYQGWISAAGFACLMLLMAAVMVSDILKQFGI